MGHHKCLSSNDSSLLSSREIVARNNVKHGALNKRRDRRDRNHSHSSHAVSRSRSNVGRSNREANVFRRRLGFNRSHNRSTNVHRKRSSNSNSSLSRNSKSRSAVILERAKARSHKTVTTDNTD